MLFECLPTFFFFLGMRNWRANNFLFLMLTISCSILHITRLDSRSINKFLFWFINELLEQTMQLLSQTFSLLNYCSLYRKALLVCCSMTLWGMSGCFLFFNFLNIINFFNLLLILFNFLFDAWTWWLIIYAWYLQFCRRGWQRKAGTIFNLVRWWKLPKQGSWEGLLWTLVAIV